MHQSGLCGTELRRAALWQRGEREFPVSLCTDRSDTGDGLDRIRNCHRAPVLHLYKRTEPYACSFDVLRGRDLPQIKRVHSCSDSFPSLGAEMAFHRQMPESGIHESVREITCPCRKMIHVILGWSKKVPNPSWGALFPRILHKAGALSESLPQWCLKTASVRAFCASQSWHDV